MIHRFAELDNETLQDCLIVAQRSGNDELVTALKQAIKRRQRIAEDRDLMPVDLAIVG